MGCLQTDGTSSPNLGDFIRRLIRVTNSWLPTSQPSIAVASGFAGGLAVTQRTRTLAVERYWG